MPTQYYLAIDLGAESGRVMLGTLDSGKIQLTQIHRFPSKQISTPETLQWDIAFIWNEILTGLKMAAAAIPNQPIAGIGIDTWGVDFALLDSADQLIGNPYHYRDKRTVGIPAQLFSKLTQAEIFRITGIQTMEINTLFQVASMTLTDTFPKNAETFLFLPDLLAFWLTGQKNIEYTIASTSQMLDARTRDWSPTILKTLKLDPKLFPPITFPGHIRGYLKPALAQQLGLQGGNKGIPIIDVGAHDTASAVAAVPVRPEEGKHWLYLSSGTWSLLGTELSEPILTPKAAEYNITNEGGINGTIRLLKNIAGMWLLQECRRTWAAQGYEYDYATLAQMAQSAPPNLAQIDPNDPCFHAAGDMPARIVAYCQAHHQTPPRTPGEFARVILESLAAAYARIIKILAEVSHQEFKTLHIVGGGSQNELLNQLAAHATGLTVYAGPVEATALGNIAVQAIATGQLKDLAQARQMLAESTQPKRYDP